MLDKINEAGYRSKLSVPFPSAFSFINIKAMAYPYDTYFPISLQRRSPYRFFPLGDASNSVEKRAKAEAPMTDD